MNDGFYLGIVLAGSISAIISMIFCLTLIIIYIISFIQIKSKNNKANKKDSCKDSFIEKNSIQDSNSVTAKSDTNSNNIGLGSNFMLIIAISNFIEEFFEFLFYFYYKDNWNKLEGFVCTLFGLFHNFFGLFSICWVSMLTYLFYCSTNITNQIFYQNNKYLLIGFLYSLTISLIFGVGPLLSNSYGNAETVCSFKYITNEEGSEKFFIYFWSFSNIVIILANNIFNLVCLIKASIYYGKKLKILKKQNMKEYKMILVYVWVFRIFPIVLLLTGLIKGASRIVTEIYHNDEDTETPTIKLILGYTDAIISNLNGFFNSLACFYFFRGVFTCCQSKSN